jgi:hypothetical protein
MSPRPLGRRTPTDWKHVERYPLRALPQAEQPTAVPVVLGINWYSNFDRPVKKGNIWVIGQGDLGTVRGGHAICGQPTGIYDSLAWWDFYDQGNAESCVGFSECRMMTLLNRRRYDATWLYNEAQRTDEYADTPPEGGTSVRAGLRILQTLGAMREWDGKDTGVHPEDGISAYRWATTWDEVRRAVNVPGNANSIPLLQSWGRYYPHVVHLVDEAGERVLYEEGEIGIPTDR